MIDERELASGWTDDWLIVMAARYTNGGIIMITVLVNGCNHNYGCQIYNWLNNNHRYNYG